ncbi:hypothetical protein V5N11_017828 [Cardamine amara subsp. amara]|uniref:RNase H type-1 domain-containing protein n=1 Tax=Cardamine amara subsp. amara TaxID=228776 RepID=A0ABD0ZI59_CARAN
MLYASGLSIADILTAQALSEAEEWKIINEKEQEEVNQYRVEMSGGGRWTKPRCGILKCNVNSSWINSTRMCGGSWLLRDHQGKAQFHARDIFLPTENITVAELRCILWAVQSLSDLRITDVELWSQCGAAIKALNNPCDWPKYRSLLNRFQRIRQKFRYCEFKNSSA